MARRDFGTIIEIERGAKYGLRWTQNDERGRRKRYETFHGNKTGAKARLREIEAEVRSRGRDRSVPTFGEAYERWYLPALAQRVENGSIKQRTVDQYVKMHSYHIRDRWDAVPVTEMKVKDIEDWRLSITRASGRLCMSVMKGVLDECVKREVISVNPARAKMLLSSKGGKLDKGIWTLEELDEMAWRGREEIFFHSVLLMAFASCRPGESLGPKVDEVRPVECGGMLFAEVDIVRQVVDEGYMTSDSDLKNEFSPRKVYVPDPWCRPVLNAAQNPSEGQILLSDAGYGTHFKQYQISKALKTAFSSGRMGALERHPWKNIRPSWQTWINWRNHIDPERREKLMGHSGTGVTAVYYDRPLDAQLMEEVARSFREYPYESPYPWAEAYPVRL